MYIAKLFNIPNFGSLKPEHFNAKNAGVASIFSETKGLGRLDILKAETEKYPSYVDDVGWPSASHS